MEISFFKIKLKKIIIIFIKFILMGWRFERRTPKLTSNWVGIYTVFIDLIKYT
jgi:hypothetical protein